MGRRLFSWRIFVLFRVGAWLLLILFAIFVGQGLNALIFLVPLGILSVGYYFWPVRAASKESYAYRYWNVHAICTVKQARIEGRQFRIQTKSNSFRMTVTATPIGEMI